MIKLHGRDSAGALRYHEAWVDEDAGEIIVHFGVVGTRGETETHPFDSAADVGEQLAAVLKTSLAAGFGEADLRPVLIEYEVDGHGCPDDVDKRYRLQARMDETLGWTGLGHCDGGSIGSGTMEVCCLVVDCEIAKAVIEQDLEGTEFADFRRVFEEE